MAETPMDNAHGVLTDEEYRIAYGLVPRLCVDLIVETEHGLLLIRRLQQPYLGAWHLPGGRVRKGETLVQAVHRIAMCEIGSEVKVNGCAGTIEFLSDQGDLGNFHSVSVALLCWPLQTRWPPDENKIWCRRVPLEPMHPTHQEFLCSHGVLESRLVKFLEERTP